MNKLYILLLVMLLIPMALLGQEIPTFSQADTLTLSWTPPTDADLEYFKAYFVSGPNIKSLTIINWDLVEVDSLRYTYFLPLSAGNWHVVMTALDNSNNESMPSDPFYFRIEDDTPPGKPVAVKLILRSN